MHALNQKLFIVLFILFLSGITAQDPIVNLPQGRIVGTKVYTDKSLVPVEIYYGIPYANPPIGRYRFSAPEKPIGWRRTFYAHRLPPQCPHISNITSEATNYSEDCLFLNIWTPRPVDGRPLPVLVIFYAESWGRGGISLPCQDLAAEDIVVVTVGYRLHLLGFFTLGSVSARGNLALLDQYLALLWIRDNIAAFGGDLNAITVLGHSAGANSVLHHLISPRSKGLFQRAIIMSPIDIWKLLDEPKEDHVAAINRTSRDVAISLGCSGNSDVEILSCIRGRSLTDILSVFSNTNWSKKFHPIPEDYLPRSEQYLPVSLPTALSNNQYSIMPVDLLFGTTSLEALNYNDETFYKLLKYNTSYVFQYVNLIAIPELLRMFSLHTTEVLPLLMRAVRWEYWDKHNEDTNKIHDAIELLARMETSARWGAGGALLAARLARHVSRLYVYRYSLPSTISLEGIPINYTGAVHGSDLIALLGDALMRQIARRPAVPEEKRYSAIFRRHIVNFIKDGYPESEDKWQRYRPGNAHTFEIRDENYPFKVDSANTEIKFWLQYLPELSKTFQTQEKTEQLVTKDESRLRGGVFAMCGVAIVLILLLCSSTFLLHRQRSKRRFSISEDVQN